MLGIGNPELGVIMLGMFVVFIMFGFPDRLHADGARRVLRLLGDGRPDLQPARPAHLFGDDERRVDLDPVVRLHGLYHRARQHPRSPVPFVAARCWPGPGLARARYARDLRDLCDRDRHRGRLRHAHGIAGVPGHAARGLRRENRCGRGVRRRLSRHSHSAERHAHSLRRDRRGLGGEALRRCLLPRHHARRPLHALRHHHDAAQSEAGAAAAGGRAQRAGQGGATGAADVVRTPGRSDRGRARLHHLRPRHPVGGGGHGLARRAAARGRLRCRLQAAMEPPPGPGLRPARCCVLRLFDRVRDHSSGRRSPRRHGGIVRDACSWGSRCSREPRSPSAS